MLMMIVEFEKTRAHILLCAVAVVLAENSRQFLFEQRAKVG
jgi:hypothetical protein